MISSHQKKEKDGRGHRKNTTNFITVIWLPSSLVSNQEDMKGYLCESLKELLHCSPISMGRCWEGVTSSKILSHSLSSAGWYLTLFKKSPTLVTFFHTCCEISLDWPLAVYHTVGHSLLVVTKSKASSRKFPWKFYLSSNVD